MTVDLKLNITKRLPKRAKLTMLKEKHFKDSLGFFWFFVFCFCFSSVIPLIEEKEYIV